jgi:hypothetical protein
MAAHPYLLSKLFLILIDCLLFVKAKTRGGKHLFFRYKYYEQVRVYSKKTGPLRKFKSGTSDKSDSDVEKSINNLYF